jgi:hypothetical protein
MTHIVDRVYISTCADVSNFLDKCPDVAVIVGDNYNNTIPLAICYIMIKYGQTYEASRNLVLSKLDPK